MYHLPIAVNRQLDLLHSLQNNFCIALFCKHMTTTTPYRPLLIALFCMASSALFSQELESIEDSLQVAYSQLAAAKTDDVRNAASQKMRSLFESTFSNPSTFSYPFEKLKISKVVSSDNHIRVLNWNQPNTDGSYKYYCYVLIRNSKDSLYKWVELLDQVRDPEKLESKFLTPEKWYGALYYAIEPIDGKKKKRSNTYLLLGWDGKDNLSTKKVIDAITLNGEKLKLGAPIFETEHGTQKRVMYEYNNEVSMSLRYYMKKKCIVLDHLAPKSAASYQVYSDYGPDGTYDMFMWKKDKFEFLDNIEVTQFADDSDKPYSDPRKKK
jgi:hypothetical protein